MQSLCYKYLMFVFSKLFRLTWFATWIKSESTYPRKGMQINSKQLCFQIHLQQQLSHLQLRFLHIDCGKARGSRELHACLCFEFSNEFPTLHGLKMYEGIPPSFLLQNSWDWNDLVVVYRELQDSQFCKIIELHGENGY